MDFNINIVHKDFAKAFELFCAQHKTEIMSFLKGDAFYVKTDTSYSDHINQILGRERMLLNSRLKNEYDRAYPKTNSNNLQGDYERECDFGVYKKAVINYLSTESSGYNSVKKIMDYDPEIDPINMAKNKVHGEYVVDTAGRNFNVVEKMNKSVSNFLENNKEKDLAATNEHKNKM